MNDRYQDDVYPQKLVAFLDILGFRGLVTQDPSLALRSISQIDGHLTHVLSVLKETHGEAFSTKLFSDCMCISCDDTLENLFYIIFEVAFIQHLFSLDGIFIRGGVSRGNHFENDRVIFSHGLLNAYALEKAATFPRVLVDKVLIDAILRDDGTYSPHYTDFRTRDFVMQAPDGLQFVDYLHVLRLEGIDDVAELTQHRRAIESTVTRYPHDTKVMSKCRWLAEYHNTKLTEMFDPDDYDEAWSSQVIADVRIDIAGLFAQFKKS